jgi:hypothetical protein
MKSLFTLLIVAALISNATLAQMGPLSISLDLTKPTGEYGEAVGLGYGGVWGYEDFLSDKVGLALHLGSTLMSVTGYDEMGTQIADGSCAILHAQLGVKYYFKDHYSGFYGMFQVGASRSTYDYMQYIFQNTSRVTTFSIGYKASRKWDYSLRLNSARVLGTSDPSRYIGLRISRTLFGDRQERP